MLLNFMTFQFSVLNNFWLILVAPLRRLTLLYAAFRLVLIASLNCYTIKIDNFIKYHIAQAYSTIVIFVFLDGAILWGVHLCF